MYLCEHQELIWIDSSAKAAREELAPLVARGLDTLSVHGGSVAYGHASRRCVSGKWIADSSIVDLGSSPFAGYIVSRQYGDSEVTCAKQVLSCPWVLLRFGRWR